MTQVTLTLGAFLRQDVVPERLAVLVAFGSFLEPLGRAALSFHFRHFSILRYFITVTQRSNRWTSPLESRGALFGASKKNPSHPDQDGINSL